MSLTLHRLHQTKITGVAALPGVQHRNLNFGTAHLARQAAGQIFSSFLAIHRQEPVTPLATTDIKIALSALGITGLAVDAADGLVCYIAKVDQVGKNATGSVHLKATAQKGNFYPMDLATSLDDPAILNFEFHALKKSGAAIWAWTTNQSLPANDTVGDLYKLDAGTVKFNGTARSGVQSAHVQFGVKHTKHKEAGDVSPTAAYVDDQPVMVEFSTLHALDFTEVTQDGLAVTSWSFFLRAFKNDLIQWDDTDAKHIKFSGGAGLLYPHQLQHARGPAHSGLRFVPQTDGTADPIVLAFDQLIA